MPLGVTPARSPTTSGAGFYALVQSVRTGLFSKKVSCLFIDVLSRSVKRGDPVELVHPDDSTTLVVGRELRDAFGQMVLDLADPHPAKTAVGAVIVARTPGLLAPPLPEEGRAVVEQLLGAVQATRSLGFPVE